MTERRLVVLYDGPIESDLELRLKNLLIQNDWTLYSVGMDSHTNERDLCFIKDTGENE